METGRKKPVANSKDHNHKPCRLIPGWIRNLVGVEDKMISENKGCKA